MSAAITPSVVQKTYVPSIGKTGTPMKLVKYTFKGTKAADADWIVTATYMQAGTPIYWNACTIDSSSDGVMDATVGCAYTSTGTKLTFSGGTSGTVYGEVWYED